MSTSDSIKQLLQRYREGRCTPEEISQLEIWFEQVQQDNETVPFLTTSDEERLVRRLQEDPRFRVPVHAKKKHGLFVRMSRAAAAVWIGLLLAAGLLIWLTVGKNLSRNGASQLAFKEVSAGSNERLNFLLPDSTVVWLNNGSSIAYHPEFATNRQVRLTGEAFFEVKHDESHPFTVKAGNLMTRVYGTAFNISSWENSSEWRVALQRGRIGVSTDTATATAEQILSPGQLLVYNTNTKNIQLLQEEPADIGAWVAGRLVFNRVPLKEVLAQLERRYHIKCIYQEKGDNIQITARFNDSSLEKVTAHLSFGWDLRFRQQGDTLFVNK
jgi:transmembrane sensor